MGSNSDDNNNIIIIILMVGGKSKRERECDWERSLNEMKLMDRMKQE